MKRQKMTASEYAQLVGLTARAVRYQRKRGIGPVFEEGMVTLPNGRKHRAMLCDAKDARAWAKTLVVRK